MGAPWEPNEAQPSQTPDPWVRAAVIVDQWELFRFGIEHVLAEVDVRVAASSAHAAEGLRVARDLTVGLLIVGKASDLKQKQLLKEAKRVNSSLKVMFLLDHAESAEVAGLVSTGADALLLRTAKRAELLDALEQLGRGERVVAPALAAGTLGRVGPVMDLEEGVLRNAGLSPRELEVLGELAEGASYRQIAESLIVTQATVKTHLVHIYSKLGVKNRQDAIARALALGLLS